jgi:Xaa-Pro aminopeptidase
LTRSPPRENTARTVKEAPLLNAKRIAAAQERLREHGADAFLILTHDDYVYFLGEDRYQPRAIIPANGPPIVVCFRGEADEIAAALGVDDVRVFQTVGQQIKDVVDVMRALLAAGGEARVKIAVRMGSFAVPAFLLALFQKANPRVEVLDVGPMIDELRVVKDEGEVAMIRRAGEIAAAGMAAARRALQPGVVELDVAAEAEYAMRKAGGHGTATPVFVNSGARSCWLHGTATEKKVAAGDLVVVDLVPRFRGYCANLCRTFAAGEPSPDQRRLHDAYLAAREAAVAVLRAGVRPRDLDAAAKVVLDPRGLGEAFVPGISHGIGLEFEELPMPTIHPTHQNVPIVASSTVTVGHSILAVPGTGGARLEDTYLVTTGPAQPLTSFATSLMV